MLRTILRAYARIIPKRCREAMGKMFQNGGHQETCANLYVTCGLSVGRQCRSAKWDRDRDWIGDGTGCQNNTGWKQFGKGYM